MESKCDICGKPSVANCSKCGIPLCNEHIEHGVSLRTNAPTIDCPNCRVSMSRKVKKKSYVLAIVFVVIAIIVILYFNSIFGFFP